MRAHSKLSILLLFLSFILVETCSAYIWSEDDMTVSYNQCNGTATIRMLVNAGGDVGGGGNDEDYTGPTQYSYRNADNTTWTAIAGVLGNACSPALQWELGATIAYEQNCANLSYVLITITSLPQSVLNLSSVRLRVTGTAFDDNDNDPFNYEADANIPSISTPTGLTASTDSCENVHISWANPGLSASCTNWSSVAKIVIYKINPEGADIEVGFVDYPNSATVDTTLSPGETAQYKVRLEYRYPSAWFGSVSKIGAFPANNTEGRRNKPPELVVGFQVSDDNCDNTVDLTWQFMTGVTSYQIFKNNFPVLNPPSGNTTSYTDSVVSGVDNYYKIRALNECGEGPFSDPIIGSSAPLAEKVTYVSAGSTDGGVLITWQDVPNATSYKISRNIVGAGSAATFDVGVGIEEYLDTSPLECISYEYRVISFLSPCSPQGVTSDSSSVVLIVPVLDNSFADDALSGSKGFFSNRIELSWSVENNADVLSGFKIYRKQLGSESDTILIASENSGSNLYIDDFADAGVLYEYFVIGETQCENTTRYSNVARDIGFRSPFGTVIGNVSYTGGIAVEGVRISASSTSEIDGHSLYLSGSDAISLDASSTLQFNNALVFESWLRPADLANDFTLATGVGIFDIYYHAGSQSFVFEVEHELGLNTSLTAEADTLVENNYIHVAFQYANDSLFYYLNGVRIAAVEDLNTSELGPLSGPIVIGAGYSGLIDETRIWNTAKTDLEINQGHSRIVGGGEPGLVGYFRYNEGAGNWAYDISRDGNAYNTNHAEFNGSPLWSDSIPTKNQLNIASFTDSLGNYEMTIPYIGVGEGFVLTPSFLIHQFDPGTRALFVGDGQFIHNNIDFEDISSFAVSGTVLYANSTCPAAGVFLSVDGNQVVIDGQPAQTDNAGAFNIQVPIGEHFISVSKPGHVFSVGRFPETGRYNFQDDLAFPSNGGFIDSTLVKVVGRVVGGLREANKQPGLGLSKNNIGQAEVEFESQLEGGCSILSVTTDATTGEYTALLPPLKYILSVEMVSSFAIEFENLDLLDLSITPQIFSAYDTTFTTQGEVFSIDSVSYNKRLDFIHRVDPIIVVTDLDEELDFIGDTIYSFLNKNTGEAVEINLRNNPFRWPIFSRLDDGERYGFLISVFEQYENAQLNLIDSVPSTDGTITVTNNFLFDSSLELNLIDINTPDTLRSIYYEFEVQKVNLLENTAFPDYSYTSTIEINVATSTGVGIAWEPIAALDMPQGGDRLFRAVFLGSKTDGAQFVTSGPEYPEYILRDPPGSESFATRETGSVKTTTANWGWNLKGGVHTEDKFFTGTSFSAGIGISTITDFQNNISVGFSAEVGGGLLGTQSTTMTNTQSWSTNAAGENIGSGSDIYIGQSRNIQYGITDNLTIIPDSLCGQVDCSDIEATPGFRYGITHGLSVIPKGITTTFIYSQDNIINEQIPHLKELRNILLLSSAKYESHLDIDSALFGLNNDDTLFQADASTTTPGIEEFEDSDGPSYTFMFEDSLELDSVRFLNQQISLWEKAIRRNEEEKANIGNAFWRNNLRLEELALIDTAYSDISGFDYANAIAGGALSLAALVTPVPGGAIIGAAAFVVTTAIGIEQAKKIAQYEEYQQAKQAINDRFDESHFVNYSISGGNTFSSSVSHQIATSTSETFEYAMSALAKIEIGGTVNNNGIGYEKSIDMNYTYSRDWTQASDSSETVSFTLFDPDLTDFFSVNVYPSVFGWGPIFKKIEGGQTSCPYEDAELSLYYEPGTVLSNATLQVDKPSLTVSPSILFNVPITESAVFNLTLGNESESDHEREYQVSLVSASNPFGAIATIDGNSDILVSVPAGSSVNKVLAIQKGPGAVYDYDDLLFVITAPCEGSNLSDSVYVSAHFIPTCTDVEFVIPEEAWVANTFNDDTIPSVIAGYDINFFDFEELKVDYKPSNESSWIGLQTFYRDTTGLNDPDAIPIPTGQSFTLYDWDIAQLTDGYYDLRTRSICTLANQTSITYSGIVDRINPHPFGTPSPADGILSPNDDISIKFNETVDLGALTSSNFDVRGVLNGTETKHATSLFFDGVDDYLDVSGGVSLKNRSFTMQVAVKRAGTGEETILSQGIDANENLYLGFNTSNQLVFRINNQEVVSTTTFDNDLWHYIGLSYDFDNETADMFLANEVESGVINVGNNSIFANYDGSGRLLMGKQGFGAANHFHGNIHEVRIWDRALSFDGFNLTMNRIMSGSEAGLLYNWRMDEAEDIFAIDHIRRRDAAIYGATWAVEPGGSGAAFDGASYLTVNSGDVLITQEMNFTLEFWFRGSGTTEETLFSNGSGGNTLADSLYSWVIDKDASGLLHARNNGLDFVLSDENYFDGEWHHLALVMNRNANLSAIIDGDPQFSTLANPFKQLSGSDMSLGAHIYQDGANVAENFFTGELDEFRFWNTNRKVAQIDRDKRNRMIGDEPALMIYLPFENYELDPTGVAILTPSFDEQVASFLHDVNNNGATLTTETPTIKLQRPVEAIAFAYSVNNDEIIITATSDPAMVENVTLDITVSNVRDLQGNVMASPVTWIAYMDKNQVVWADDLLIFEKAIDDDLSFESQVVNQGGAAKAFTIENVPSWMSVNPASGTIPPNSTLAVSFQVDPLMNIGDYVQDVQLLTDFDFAEKLTIDLKVRETAPDWAVNPADFQNSMGIIGILEIKGVTSSDTEDMLVAFVGDEVRGMQNLTYVEDLDRYLVFMDVYSNTAGGDQLTFKIWDAGSGVVYSQVTPTSLVFTSNDLIGTILDPQVFETNFEIEDKRTLYEGWNWVGYYLQNEDSANFNTLFTSLNSQTGDQINGQLIYANYTTSTEWTGPLANTGVRPESGYKFYKNQADTLVISGDIIDPTSRTISLVDGWNWMGFISIRNQSITQALGNLTPVIGDLIKGQSAFAVYANDALGWQGTLQTLEPGDAYMFKSGQDAEFTFPFAGQFKRNRRTDKLASHPMWPVDYGAYSSNMNLILSPFNDCDIDVEWSQLLVGAFDETGEIRGLANVNIEEDAPKIYLTTNADTDTQLQLKWIDVGSGMVYPEATEHIFEANTLVGSFDVPIGLKLPTTLCDGMLQGNQSDVQVYPTVFDNRLTVEVNTQVEGLVKITLYDMSGRPLYEQQAVLTKGHNQVLLDMSGGNLASGTYTLMVETDQIAASRKVIKTK